MLPNDAKLRNHLIDKLESDFVLKKNTAISSVENTIKNLYIQKNMHLLYQQDLYKNKQKEIYEILLNILFPS